MCLLTRCPFLQHARPTNPAVQPSIQVVGPPSLLVCLSYQYIGPVNPAVRPSAASLPQQPCSSAILTDALVTPALSSLPIATKDVPTPGGRCPYSICWRIWWVAGSFPVLPSSCYCYCLWLLRTNGGYPDSLHGCLYTFSALLFAHTWYIHFI